MFFAEQPRLFQIIVAVFYCTYFEINFKLSLLRALLEEIKKKRKQQKTATNRSGLMFCTGFILYVAIIERRLNIN